METTPSNLRPFTAAEKPAPIELPEACTVSGTLHYVPGQSGICESFGITNEHTARSQAHMMVKLLSASMNGIDSARPVYEAIRDGDISIEILAACYMMLLAHRMVQFTGRE